jgi:hypothetical protein
MTKLDRVVCLLGVLALATLLIVTGTGCRSEASPPVVTTTSLPNGEVNIAYASYLVGYSGTTPYTWSIASGNLPAGLSISTTGTISGLISGTPTQPGIFSFKVQATDANGRTRAYDITVDIFFFILGLGCSIFVLVGLFSGLAHLDFLVRSKRWPFVKGTIQTSRVIIEDKGTDDNGNPILLCHPEILYRYQVEEREYIVRDPVYGSVYWKQGAEELVAAYPVGKQINVFYNPKKPQESTLKEGLRTEWLAVLIFFSVMVAGSVICFVQAFKA